MIRRIVRLAAWLGLGVALSLTLSGQPSGRGVSTHYDVIIRNGEFDQTEIDSIVYACAMWEAAVSELHLPTRVGDCDGIHDLVICVGKGQTPKPLIAEAYSVDDIDGSRIYISPGYVLPGIVAHEIGHGMGLPDTKNEGTLMCWDTACGSDTPTLEDVRAWYALRWISPDAG